jgi:hypothetical protein
MAKKKVASKAKPTSKNLVTYVENSSPKIKVFSSAAKAKFFIDTFNKKYPTPQDGWWVDLLVTGITGKVVSFDTLEIERG